MPSAVSDEELMSRVERGDVDAFDMLYDRHAAYVNGVCFFFLRSVEESEDVLQEIFVRLWQGGVRYDVRRGRLRTWLYSIAKNRCLDRLKGDARRTTKIPLLEDAGESTSAGPEAEIQAVEDRRKVVSALADLPPLQREAIEQCFFRSPTYREAAASLGIPEGTLKSRVRLAMNKLAAKLDSEGLNR